MNTDKIRFFIRVYLCASVDELFLFSGYGKIVPMTIFINGEARELEGISTLSALLDAFELPKQRVAVELNRQVIRKQDWVNTQVSENDKIEVVHFVGGG